MYYDFWMEPGYNDNFPPFAELRDMPMDLNGQLAHDYNRDMCQVLVEYIYLLMSIFFQRFVIKITFELIDRTFIPMFMISRSDWRKSISSIHGITLI